MGGYSSFAYFYDILTQNIDYSRRALYFDSLIKLHGDNKGLLLDLACGTGSLSEEMAKLGYDVIAADSSVEMLSAAMSKKAESGLPIQYICQSMTELDLYGGVDVTICALDSLNHLPDAEAIFRTFQRVNIFTEPRGLFIFDMNTPYKHMNTLGNNTFVYDMDDLYCVWSCCLDVKSEDNRVDITLDFFSADEDGSYQRYSDELSEIAPKIQTVDELVCNAGFEILAKYDYDTLNPPKENSDKLVWVCRKANK